MTERGMQRKKDDAKQSWETSDAPIVCETCLGDNAYVRMTKEAHGVACKTCEKPFTVFRWKAGSKGRFKSTVICNSCAKMKNVCQTCIFDLQYGLPVRLRDKVLEEYGAGAALVPVPQSDANREWYLQQHQNGIAQGSGMVQNEAANAALMKLARKGPNYERNLPKICSFFEKGECNRGSRCPFRHEKAREGEGKGNMDQDIRDRWFGKGEGGGAARGIERHEQNKQKISAPADHTIKTLYVGDLGEWGNEKELHEGVKSAFYSYGEISAIRVSYSKNGGGYQAFVEYESREAAELAAQSTSDLFIGNGKVFVKWAYNSNPSGGSSSLLAGAVGEVQMEQQPEGAVSVSAVGVRPVEVQKQATAAPVKPAMPGFVPFMPSAAVQAAAAARRGAGGAGGGVGGVPRPGGGVIRRPMMRGGAPTPYASSNSDRLGYSAPQPK